jgi:hypothetical protein
MKTARIEGSSRSTSRCPDPEGTPIEIAAALMNFESGNPAIPDAAVVVLTEEQQEEYTPPRCRRPRTRSVSREIARFTLGEIRRQLADAEATR